MNFDGFHPFPMLFFFSVCCKRGGHLYTTTAPSCCIPASYCHLSATLQTTSNTVANLHKNRAVCRIFIALLRFSFESRTWWSQSLCAPDETLSLFKQSPKSWWFEYGQQTHQCHYCLFTFVSAVTDYTACPLDNYLFIPYIHCCVVMANPL
jgi:hypothetical protein